MKYCSTCGEKVILRVPRGDHLERFVCEDCGEIHYQNPKIVTGCLPVWEDKVLLCKRAIEPRHGKWTLPAGFMENAESAQQGAARETWEEACASVEVASLYTTVNLPHINQVYMMFLSRLTDLDFAPGPESLEVALFKEQEIPWQELAFPVVTETLKFYFQDVRQGHFPHRTGDIEWVDRSVGRYQFTLLGNPDT
ncbi:MAG: NUDIX hydrolase [bacterium]